MLEVPKFVRKFSEENSADKKKELVDKNRIKIREAKNRKREISEREKELKEKLAELKALQEKLDALSSSGLKKITNYFKLRKVRASLALGEKTYEELKAEREKMLAGVDLSDEKKDLKISDMPEYAEAQKSLDDFYQQERYKWVNSEYSKEDIDENFSEEHLASLSLEDYVLLLKRFPGEMVSHVTRQGIRDHSGMVFHSAGEGEYQNGFVKIIEDGRLRSPLGTKLIEEEKEKAVASFLKLEKRGGSKRDAIIRINDYTREDQQIHQEIGGEYVDSMAVHFAAQEVPDCFYGSEKGNEIFFAFPSAFIASQYYFNGNINSAGGGQWNDLWVWANEEKGININAGLIFIPKNAQVNRGTGSRYELDENKNPIINEEYKNKIRTFVDSPDFLDFAEKVMEIIGKTTNELISESFSASELKEFRDQLSDKYNISDVKLQNCLLDYKALNSLVVEKKYGNGDREAEDSKIKQALEEYGILFKESDDTIVSEEFWENYFASHPGKKPSKIVYYQGENPSQAIYDWKRANEILKKSSDENIGFPERHVSRDDPQATSGMDRFRSLALDVIDKYFSPEKIQATRKRGEDILHEIKIYSEGNPDDDSPPLDLPEDQLSQLAEYKNELNALLFSEGKKVYNPSTGFFDEIIEKGVQVYQINDEDLDLKKINEVVKKAEEFIVSMKFREQV